MGDERELNLDIDVNSFEAATELKRALFEAIACVNKEYKNITFLCIGTDKVIVDSVGPLIGSIINKNIDFVEVIGDLNDNINALNLERRASNIDNEENLIIAVDACMSTKKEVGTVVISNKALLPGKALGKELGEYGDISIKVVVSDDSDNFYRGTSLGMVMKMADVVGKAINETLEEISLKEASLTCDTYEKNDPFMDENMVLDRLRREYKEYGQLIIAYDFDYTINSYRDEPWNYPEVIQLLKDWESYATFICFTAAGRDRHNEIRTKIKELGVPLNYLNRNAKGVKLNGRKIFYSILLDDRSGLSECVRVLRKLITEIKERELLKIAGGTKNV